VLVAQPLLLLLELLLALLVLLLELPLILPLRVPLHLVLHLLRKQRVLVVLPLAVQSEAKVGPEQLLAALVVLGLELQFV